PRLPRLRLPLRPRHPGLRLAGRVLLRADGLLRGPGRRGALRRAGRRGGPPRPEAPRRQLPEIPRHGDGAGADGRRARGRAGAGPAAQLVTTPVDREPRTLLLR
uniref:Uncharacterized protein n=1 Tax=Triticum urartu TaxID=4572 RepID=A0A8R7TQ76_TRIUA